MILSVPVIYKHVGPNRRMDSFHLCFVQGELWVGFDLCVSPLFWEVKRDNSVIEAARGNEAKAWSGRRYPRGN